MNLVFLISYVLSSTPTAKHFLAVGSKVNSVHPYFGEIHRQVVTDLHALKALIDSMQSNAYAFICLGVSVFQAAYFTARINFQQAVLKNPWTITKTDEHLMYPLNSVIFIDYDFSEIFPLTSYEELVEVVNNLIPELKGVGKLVRYSSSTGIYNKSTNYFISNKTSMHLFMLATNVTDETISKLKQLLNNAMVHHGFVKMVEAKKVSVLDDTSFSKQKPIFTANPILEEPLARINYESVVFDGAVLDMNTIEYSRYGEVKALVNTAYGFKNVDLGNRSYIPQLRMYISQATIENLAYLGSLKVKQRDRDLYSSIKPYITGEITEMLMQFVGFKKDGNGMYKIRSERTASVSVMTDGFINDFGNGGFKGDIVNLIKEEFNSPFKDALLFVADALGVTYE